MARRIPAQNKPTPKSATQTPSLLPLLVFAAIGSTVDRFADPEVLDDVTVSLTRSVLFGTAIAATVFKD